MTDYRQFGGLLCVAFVAASVAGAQDVVDNPSVFATLPIGQEAISARSDEESGPAEEPPDEVSLEMNVELLERSIYNPVTRSNDRVQLRGYRDARADETDDLPLVGPTISVAPGQTARVRLNNRLPPDETCGMGGGGSVNTPHCFNGTNLHSHGLWVNPSGNGDNVLISIRPGVSFEYEYAIPAEHPAGTFWYHPHLHGSTALQVSSGMSGAIIIRDDRAPVLGQDGEIARPGDLDRLLSDEEGNPISERILVLQQIQYACRYTSGPNKGQIRTDADGTYICDPGQIGRIDGYDQFGPESWPTSGRYTSVNGRVLGTLASATVGAPERWRLIHAGVRDTINFEIRPKTGSGSHREPSAEASDDWIDQNCGSPLEYHVVAQDGLTMSAAQGRTQAVLQPGYRVDALVTFPEAGEYCVVDAAAPAAGSVNQAAPSRRLIGVVTATGTAAEGTGGADWLRDWLVAAAERTMPADVVERVTADLDDGLKLTAFVPHPDVSADELTGTQELVFNIDTTLPGATFFEVDGRPYDPNRVDRVLPLGGVEEWTLQSDFVSHPFHIHVNPFQIVEILDASGRDVSVPDADDGGDPQYAGLKGVWKDTLLVKNPRTSPSTRYTIVIRTRYQRYIGDFVLHCHILDHEDQGMMQNIRISLPDGAGGIAAAHH
jgi:L-ascorbate oxidase